MVKLSEHKIQSAFFDQVRIDPKFKKFRKLIFAVPNGGSRNFLEAINLKRSGVEKGVADVICLIPNKHYHGLLIEFKYGKNKQTQEQIDFQSQAENVFYRYKVCYTTEEAISELLFHINNI